MIADRIVNNPVDLGYRSGMGSAHQEKAERLLRDAILGGSMPPGYRLVEAELVELTGVPRGAVRLAIDALAVDGLVERVPNKGARVRVVSTEEAIAITECRMPLEGLLARKAAERLTDEQAGRLRAHLQAMADAVEAGDVVTYSQLIGRLYELVHEAARHPVAAGLVARLQAQLVRHQFRLSLRPGRPRVSLRELTQVVAAVADRDPDRAEAATAAHFRSVLAELTVTTPDTGGLA